MQSFLSGLAAQSVSFELSNGRTLFSGLSFSLTEKRYGLLGPNGIGKSTLAKILAGEISPSQGSLSYTRKPRLFHQHEDPPQRLLLGEFLEDPWTASVLDSSLWSPLLEGLPWDIPLSQFSGGEWTRARLAKTLAHHAGGLLILDEPTNNLDTIGKKAILHFIKSYPHSLIVISHDRGLLGLMDSILELSNLGLSTYGGNYGFYLEQKKSERGLQQKRLQRLRKDKKKHEREQHEKLESQAKRIRRGNAQEQKGGIPRILAGRLKRKAQANLGKIQKQESQRGKELEDGFNTLYEKSKREDFFRLPLLTSTAAKGKLIFELQDANVIFSNGKQLWERPLSFTAKGPLRIALSGANGCGKSTLIKTLLGEMPTAASLLGEWRLADIPVALLDQNYTLLDHHLSPLENVLAATTLEPTEVRNRMAQFQFLGDDVNQSVRTLSGGEKLKAALAKIFLSSPTPQFIILDEPTNNLDIESLEILESALIAFRGALLVVSHDETFLRNIGVETTLTL